jgi:[ribosomal protein S18]-alanine N-acetyltransferase
MTPMTQLHVSIRYLLRRDLSEVLAIERASFEFPWDDEHICTVLGSGCCVGLAAECHGFIVGHCVYRLHRDWIELLTFAVHPDCRRHGVGRQLVAKLVVRLLPLRKNRLAVYLRETNLPAQLFFRAAGFRAERVLREHFPDTGEDGYAMIYDINS